LPEIITPNQSVFLPGRLISDNIIVAYELTHFLLNKREGDLGYAAMVEWSFLENMMRRVGFSDMWIQLIMECVTTVLYRVKVNGELSTSFVPQRGLR
jgi:C4-dicarboxylate transporter